MPYKHRLATPFEYTELEGDLIGLNTWASE